MFVEEISEMEAPGVTWPQPLHLVPMHHAMADSQDTHGGGRNQSLIKDWWGTISPDTWNGAGV